MKFTIDRDAFSRGLAAVQSVVERKSTQPILAHVLVEAVGEAGVRVSGTDTTVAYYGGIKADVAKPGALAVDAASLMQVVRSMPAGTIKVSVAKSRIVLASGRTEFKLPGLDPAEFPPRPEFEAKSTATMSESELRRLIGQVGFSIDPTDLRYGLNGVKVEVEDGRVRMVSTDGHRMSMAMASFEGELAPSANTLIPRKALSVIGKLVSGDGTVSIAFGDSAMQVSRTDRDEVFWFRMIEGEFPDYRAVLPTKHDRTIELSAGELSAAVARVAILLPANAKAVRFTFDKGGLAIDAANDRGEVNEQVPAELNGDPVVVGFNSRYVAEAVGAARGERVTVELTHELAPVVMRDSASPDTVFVLMPLRLD